MLDNPRVHKAHDLGELVEACGTQLLFLLPDSSDFMPIERAVGKLQTHLRAAAACPRKALITALQAALACITPEDAKTGLAPVAFTLTAEPLWANRR